MKNSKFSSAISIAACLAALIASTSCGPGPINGNSHGNGNSGGNSNGTLVASPSPAPTAAACPSKGDDDIIDYIAKGVANSKDLTAIRKDINWDSKDCSIKLFGATQTKDNYQAFVGIAQAAPSRIGVDLQYLSDSPEAPHGCTDGWLQCGDICIPPDQKCNNIITAGVRATPTPTRTP